ncbi:Zn(II)2Cys6 domain-containing transcription factor fumR [Aspergillus foveolatus]|uniref:Zn(II)2Cys6 domain-containing transcription factor fumR n=1 Tax=Aspergillus foveolatus TaxID=210207 RepID=UPI003CCE4C7A
MLRALSRPYLQQSSAKGGQQQLQRHANDNSTRHQYANQDGPDGAADGGSDQFQYLQTGLLDMSTDLHLGLGPSSLSVDIHPALTASYCPPDVESRAPTLHENELSCSQASLHLRAAEQAVQIRWRDFHHLDASDDLCDFSLPTTMHYSFSSIGHRHCGSLARNIGSDGRDSGYGNELSPSDLLQSPYRDAHDSYADLLNKQQDQEEPSSSVCSWIRNLPDTNGKGTYPVDSTFQLSSQYTGLLTTICDQLESHRACNDTRTRAQLALDQPSQLLVFSSYMCLLASYDKVLQHIKAWLEVRLKMGVRGIATALPGDEGSMRFPIQLRRLAVGSFELPQTSSTQSFALTCMMEANVMQMHSLISEIMKPVSTDVTGSALREGASRPPAAEKRPMNGVAAGEVLSTVATVTLRAIKANEDAILQLVETVSKLALQRVYALTAGYSL